LTFSLWKSWGSHSGLKSNLENWMIHIYTTWFREQKLNWFVFYLKVNKKLRIFNISYKYIWHLLNHSICTCNIVFISSILQCFLSFW
jgi:hypothetical protein